MRENEGNEDLMREFEQEAFGDGATSQEFDKFLRKRSEAALYPKQFPGGDKSIFVIIV